MKPLWFVNYDPVRTKASTMRFSSRVFNTLKSAKEYIISAPKNHPHSFQNYAIVRYMNENVPNKVVLSGNLK